MSCFVSVVLELYKKIIRQVCSDLQLALFTQHYVIKIHACFSTCFIFILEYSIVWTGIWVVVVGGQSLGPPWVSYLGGQHIQPGIALAPCPRVRARDCGAIPDLSTEHLRCTGHHAVNPENSFFMREWAESGFSRGLTWCQQIDKCHSKAKIRRCLGSSGIYGSGTYSCDCCEWCRDDDMVRCVYVCKYVYLWCVWWSMVVYTYLRVCVFMWM